MTKICLKCNTEFQQKQEINGKIHNLQNRKFCLSCSPFKHHNTRDITKPKVIQCHSRNYKLLTDEQKKHFNKMTAEHIQKRRLNRKLTLVYQFGGKCEICQYNKNYAALNFHHKNPNDKVFSLSSREIAAYSWDKLLVEANKCQLLCSNCHMEHHHPQCKLS